MERRRFGNTDMEVSVLGFGGAEIGFERAPQADVDRMLNAALDTGLNVIDTAECYGESEEMIGKAISARRNEFFLFTKIGHSSGFSEADWDPAMLAKQIDRGLQRLQTDRVDLIQLHSCGEDILRDGRAIEVLRRAKEAGKTRYVGYSGDWKHAKYAVDCGLFDSLQTSCNFADQESIELTVGPAAAKGMGVIAKRPIANVAWAKGSDPNAYSHPYWQRLQKLQYPFLTDPDAAVGIALRFTLAQTEICTAIVGTKNPARWAANVRFLEDGPLGADEIKAIKDRWAECVESDWVGQG